MTAQPDPRSKIGGSQPGRGCTREAEDTSHDSHGNCHGIIERVGLRERPAGPSGKVSPDDTYARLYSSGVSRIRARDGALLLQDGSKR